MRKLRIYGFPTQVNGCAKYRIWQPLDTLGALGLAEVRRQHELLPISGERVDEIFRWADVVVCQPFSDLAALALVVAARNQHGKKLVVDLDDDIYAVHPLNVGEVEGKIAYIANKFTGRFADFWEVLGNVEGVRHRPSCSGGKCLTPFTYRGNVLWLHQYDKDIRLAATCALEEADLVTTTNQPLASVFRQHTNAPLAVLPNCLSFKEWEPGLASRPKPNGAAPTLAWAGSVSHYPDVLKFLGGLDEAMERFPQLHTHILGSSFDYLFPPQPDIQREPVVGYAGGEDTNIPMWWAKYENCGERWPGRMAFSRPVPIGEYVPWLCGNFPSPAIGLAPLEDNPFNQAKSELKWVEYAALGVPTIASRVGPYARTIRHGEDGLLVGSTGALGKAITRLVEDPPLRQRLAQAAEERVRAEYDAEREAPRWVEAYEKVV